MLIYFCFLLDKLYLKQCYIIIIVFLDLKMLCPEDFIFMSFNPFMKTQLIRDRLLTVFIK